VTKAETLSARVEAAIARRSGTITFMSGDTATPVPWAELHDDARRLAADMQARGIGPGAHVALLGPTTRPLVTAIQATWLAGAALVVLPLPMRLGSIEEFVDQTRTRIANADASLLVVDPDLAAFYEPEPGDPPMVLLDELGRGRSASAFSAPTVDPGALCALQFTSGSTADPKGVMLTHRQVLANLDGAVTAADVDPDTDVLVSWLPLYHDMGLIGLLTIPMITGADLVLAPPQDFLAAPARWLQWMSAFGGTGTAGPNFSYALAARALRRSSGLDLSRWRIALNGAEPVDPASVDAFCEAGAPFGFNAGAAFPAFGMAELGIAGTFPIPGKGMRVDHVDRTVLETERYAAPVDMDRANARPLALLGTPIPGLEMRICDPVSGDAMKDREVGELELRGDSVTPGYYKRPDETAATFHNGWLRTGDLAYVVDGQLVVCGRIKDVIIVGGRNVFPEDVERAAAEVEGVRAGNVIAFGVQGRKGRERLIVVAETKSDDPDPVRTEVARKVSSAVGLPPGDVVLVAPGSLPKTSSGKLQRSLCRNRYLTDALQTT
jgi:fatty-acyl-CoA synthase